MHKTRNLRTVSCKRIHIGSCDRASALLALFYAWPDKALCQNVYKRLYTSRPPSHASRRRRDACYKRPRSLRFCWCSSKVVAYTYWGGESVLVAK